MKNISLSNKGLLYGINLFEVFWAKHEIILYENVRKSRDEELVAQLITYIADKENAQTTSFYLDAIYQKGSAEEEQLLKKINKYGYKTIYTRFCYVFDEIKNTLDSNKSKFRKLVFRNKSKRVPRVYQVIYIAFYKALIVQNLQIGNYVELCKSLENIYDNHLSAINRSEKWHCTDREKLSDSILGVILKHFSPKSGSDQNLSSWVKSLENILNESQTEQVCYDFKLGLNKISDNSGTYIPKTLNKIIKTLTAMTNTKPGSCYIILGVADKKEDANLHNSHYGSSYITYNNFCITGIDNEAKKYHSSMSEYEQKILQEIDKEPISNSFRQQIKSNIVTFSYNNKEILLFKVSRGSKPERYDESIYTRSLSHLEKINRDDEFDFFERFQLENTLSPNL